MILGNIALGVICILYTIAAVAYWSGGVNWLAIAFLCYAVANVGLMMSVRGT